MATCSSLAALAALLGAAAFAEAKVFLTQEEALKLAFPGAAVERKTIFLTEAEQKEVESRAIARRKAEMEKMADDFEGAIGNIVETVSSASSQLEASATTLTSTAERAENLTTRVASASEQASTNVQSVASATEEMASAVMVD